MLHLQQEKSQNGTKCPVLMIFLAKTGVILVEAGCAILKMRKSKGKPTQFSSADAYMLSLFPWQYCHKAGDGAVIPMRLRGIAVLSPAFVKDIFIAGFFAECRDKPWHTQEAQLQQGAQGDAERSTKKGVKNDAAKEQKAE